MALDVSPADRFPRVVCDRCGRLCLVAHAGVYKIVPLTGGHGEFVHLCRVPATILADGGHGYEGCGPTEVATSPHAVTLVRDPNRGRKAPPPIAGLD